MSINKSYPLMYSCIANNQGRRSCQKNNYIWYLFWTTWPTWAGCGHACTYKESSEKSISFLYEFLLGQSKGCPGTSSLCFLLNGNHQHLEKLLQAEKQYMYRYMCLHLKTLRWYIWDAWQWKGYQNQFTTIWFLKFQIL